MVPGCSNRFERFKAMTDVTGRYREGSTGIMVQESLRS
jgi:hypothetical protein